MSLLQNNNQKMAGAYVFNLPPKVTCPGAVFGETSVCRKCYGCKGNYSYPSAKKHFLTQMEAVMADDFVDRIVGEIIRRMKRVDLMRLRLHPVGDFFSATYAAQWCQVLNAINTMTKKGGALAGHKLQVWAPTKSYTVPEILDWLIHLNGIRGPGVSVVVRPSAKYIGDPAPKILGLSGGAAVSMTKNTCPAIEQHSSCVEAGCEVCWENRRVVVTYRLH